MAHLSSDEILLTCKNLGILLQQACKSRVINQVKNIFSKITNFKDDEGKTPITNAVENGDSDIVKYLISIGAKLDDTLLEIAAQKGHTEVAKSLVKNGAIVDAKDKNGNTPLYIASEKGHLEIVKFLIESKAQVNHKCLNEWTPLHVAAQNGHTEIAK